MLFLRRLIAAVLLFGVLSNCFSYFIISTSYHFNKNYIASVLCTNRDKPALHCEGKCFLDIKLKELEQKSKQEQEHSKRLIESVVPQAPSMVFLHFETPLKTQIPHYLQQKPVGISNAIFHPPQQV
jgi:hypothetical protein